MSKMEYVSMACLSRFKDQAVQLKGWVYHLRSSGRISFLVLRDGSGQAQCVLRHEKLSSQVLSLLRSLKQEDCIEVHGVVKFHKEYEVHADNILKFNLSLTSQAPAYPLGKKDHGIDFLLTHRHLWLRSKKPWAVLRIRHEITRAIHDFFLKNHFVQVDAPVLTPSACEGSAELFSLNFFESREMFLSQSGQLYMEAAAAALGKVYCFNPVFRAEKSSTRRHLLEFWMVEPEMAFYNLNECMNLAEKLIEYVVAQVLKNRTPELEILNRDLKKLENIKAPFPRLSYQEALRVLAKKKHLPPGANQKGLGGEDETILSSAFDKPVFIHRYPLNAKAFYMKTDPQNPDLSLSFDLLGPEGAGELVGGSQREDNEQLLEQKIKAHGLERSPLKWYRDLRTYGSFPHSGFGLGLERTVSWLCGLPHVREASPFPRLYGREFF